MTEPMKLSRWRAHERRSEFDAKARALAGAASLPTRPHKTGFPLPAWASFYADDRALAVLVCPGERWQTVEKALAYGVAHAQGRKLELVIPEHRQGKRNPVQATLVRAAFLRTDIQLWTHDGNTARPSELLDPEGGMPPAPGRCAARRGTRSEGPCMAGHQPGELGRQPVSLFSS